MKRTKHKCEYGCGQDAVHQLKNGKWCCAKSQNSCPSIREKISKAEKGKYVSEKTRKRMSKSRKGKRLSEETKRKLSMLQQGRHHSEETRKQMSKSHKGICHSEDTKKKMSKFSKGRKFSEETRKKLSIANGGENHHLWGKKHSEETKKKISENCTYMSGENHPRWGKKLSEETKKKMRIAHIKNIEKRCGQCFPAYNPKACQLLNEYAKENKLNIQHAENGGEFRIKELGYWVDGYDKKKNIVVEVDEFAHFDVYGQLKKRDIQRQVEITEYLGCEFIRLQI